jgi:endonuclease YncB( thermonuclease family)
MDLTRHPFLLPAVAIVTAGLMAAHLLGLGKYMVSTESPPPPALFGHPRVIDGHIIIIIGETYVRLFGMDAPDNEQLCNDAAGKPYPCGQIATAELKRLIGDRAVRCDQRDTDRYGRTVAVCFADGVDLNREMVSLGWAIAYRFTTTAYAPEEDEARAERLGIWQGTFEEPSQWRSEHHGR